MNKLIFTILLLWTLGMAACSDSTFDNKSGVTPDPYITPKVTPSKTPEPMFTKVPKATPKPASSESTSAAY